MLRGGARAHVDADRVVVLADPDGLRGSDDIGLFAGCVTPLFLVDGNNLLWRAAHGHPAPFPADDGRDLTPVFRFFSLLRRAIGAYGVFAECVVCFDGRAAWSERLDIDPTYKANRDYEGADLTFMTWLPEIRAALDGAGIFAIELEAHEADDVIATLTRLAEGRAVRILSTDRDYVQLVGPNVHIVDPRSRPQVADEDAVVARYGVLPRQWCDFRALTGDPSDGIPGIPGIGPIRAAALLAGGLRLDDLSEAGRLADERDRVVSQRWDDLLRWRKLIRLQTDVPLPVTLRGCPTPKIPSPVAVCRELGLVGSR